MYSHIRYLFFDLDHTLWDFETNSNETLLELFEEHGLAQFGLFDFEGFMAVYKRVNHGLWDQYNRGQVTKERLRERRFKETFEQLGLEHKHHPEPFSDQYIFRCTEKPAVFPDAHKVLDQLKQKFGMSIITNGFPESQSRKMAASRLDHYFDHIIISEEVGFAKPHPGIFESALNRSGMKAGEVLMIGDNLFADVEGAEKAGIKALWFNPDKKETPEGIQGIHHLSELLILPGLL
ncbi:MAG: noncanonical pyrimidine nucleotidase, YjjG family [Bacteroidetes bacterium]|nr:MAG: noncanonical pyrimidine nucleotidase, YjjG family [Bacteroidota bacterium]